MSKLVARGYITEGVILAFTSFFSFPKSTEYIRMVFDNTVSGLKDSLWATNFIFHQWTLCYLWLVQICT